jgi:hypothetical protein
LEEVAVPGWCTGRRVDPMKQRRQAAGVLAFVALVMLAGPTQRAMAVDDSDIDAKIAAAKTPADHEAIAAYYDGKAKDARDKAAEHTKMAKEYRSVGHLAKGRFPEHCEGLARIYTSAAKEYEAMAKAHRDMAAHAK